MKRKMKKRVGMTLALACMAAASVCAQEGWEITPEAGMVVNKDHFYDKTYVGFKMGVGVYHEIIHAEGREKPSFGLNSGLFVVQQRGGYHAMNVGNIPVGNGRFMDGYFAKATRYYLQLPLMARWRYSVADNVKINLGLGPYAGIGLGGKGSMSYNARLFSEESFPDLEPVVHEYYEFDPFKGKHVNEEYRIDASPRFDWGVAAAAGVTVDRVTFTIDFQTAFGNTYEQQNDFRIRNYMVSFTFGYTL